jgi:3-methyladenine DNA glycosylase Tag
MTKQQQKLAHAYLDAKDYIIQAGYEDELAWQESVQLKDITEIVFLREYTWVVLSSGFKEATLRKKFAAIEAAFMGFKSAKAIYSRKADCRRNALKAFAHRSKIDAIIKTAKMVAELGFDHVWNDIQQRGVTSLRRFSYLGPVTSIHLAKNLGLEVVKPDRHLVRAAKLTGHNSPYELCCSIKEMIGDNLAVVDLVIWRYATLQPRTPLPMFAWVTPSQRSQAA